MFCAIPRSWLVSHRCHAVFAVAATVVSLAVSPLVARAETYYAATDGDDATGNGSAQLPWATIAHAVNTGISPEGGDTVLVRDGVYRGTSLLRRAFPVTVTVRAEHAYRATLTGVDQGRESIRVYIYGPARLVIDGFVLTNRHPTYTCDGREPNYVVHLQDVSAVTLQNNIVFGNNAPGTCNELLKINRGNAQAYPKDIVVRGNVFYDPANAGGADMIDSVRPGEIEIVGNIFFSDPARDASHSFITIKRQAPAVDPGTPRFIVRRNVFLNWGGSTDQAFIQFGEDGVPEYEITDALVENNLFLGNSPARMAAPVQLKGVRGVRVRANTAVGDMPGGAYAIRVGTEGRNLTVGDISVTNNIWSDHSGTMGRRLINAYGDVDLTSFILRRNLYWNAGGALPEEGAVTPADDSLRIVADPGLSTDHSGVVLPVWDETSGSFASGNTTILEEFVRLVEMYGAIPDRSPAVDAADPDDMPSTDIRGLPRDAEPDLGAYEVQDRPTVVPTKTITRPPAGTRTPTPSLSPSPTPLRTSSATPAPTRSPTRSPLPSPTVEPPVFAELYLPLAQRSS